MKEEEHECVGHVNLALEPDHLPGLQPRNTPHLPRRLLTAARTSHSSIHLGVDQEQALVHHDDQARIDEAAVITVSTRNPKGPLPSSLGSNDLRSGLDQVLVTRRPLSFSLRTNVLSAALEQVLIHRGYCW